MFPPVFKRSKIHWTSQWHTATDSLPQKTRIPFTAGSILGMSMENSCLWHPSELIRALPSHPSLAQKYLPLQLVCLAVLWKAENASGQKRVIPRWSNNHRAGMSVFNKALTTNRAQTLLCATNSITPSTAKALSAHTICTTSAVLQHCSSWSQGQTLRL